MITQTEPRSNSTVHCLGEPGQGLIPLSLSHLFWKLSTNYTNKTIHS